MVIVAAMASATCAETHHVSTSGNDANPGTAKLPFRTVTKAVASLGDGGTCIVHQGSYRATAAVTDYKKDAPLIIKAAPGERVVFDGREPVTGPWTRHNGNIYRAGVSGRVEQVFLADRMMVEARWPNMKFPKELWDRSRWAKAGGGSRAGVMVSPALAKTKTDWTDGLAVLNIAQQWWTWTSRVTKHSRGQERFEYDIGKLSGVFERFPFGDDRYYLTGKLAALDAPGEWYHDPEKSILYLWAPNGKAPPGDKVYVKRRDYGLVVKNSRNIHISGIHFFGCAFDLSKVEDCVVEDCRLLYPGFSREITERYAPPHRGLVSCASVAGNHNVVRNCSFGYSSGTGLRISGAYNVIENNLVHDVCWSGSLDYNALRVDGRYGEGKGNNVIRRNTLLNGGNCLLHVSGPQNIVELNHVYNGGYACLDVSLFYTSLPLCAGTEVRYNWVHGCFAPHIAIGIRGDDKTRKLRVHHNVAWDCGWEGIVVKGDENLVYNNTGFKNGKSDLLMYSGAEPDKDWHKQWPPVPEENKHSKVFNNLGRKMRGHRGRNIPPGGDFVNNREVRDVTALLRDAAKYDFRPKPGSALVDAGIVKEDCPVKFRGKAPDIGAYESGEEPWIPGITWDPEKVLDYQPRGYK